ncbi:MAG: hypothetical protein PHW63_08260 [Alphaproteobacteria bacterium]|nr:hypothetical protein [Alphaproteobacteria bacterium]
MMIYIGIGIGILGLVLILYALRKRGEIFGGGYDSLEHFQSLLKEGIRYEDDFVENYRNKKMDDSIMELFGENRTEAEKIFNILLEESLGHKRVLANILAKLK